MKWVKLTDYNGAPVWVNLATAAQIIRYEGHDTTSIDFASGERNFTSVIVKEPPDDIFYQAGHQKWG